ncbi:hypothetical protein CSKR_202577 [Clonorchis sinensis]|uniref:Uncharacterized protein n=1 Tax=Clonorchis sinensis TaxID=79923 RepID=A0A8T1M186_CLOSI|nr:hypothetical protein CSKR_202577 [Clonorchis sinensis]
MYEGRASGICLEPIVVHDEKFLLLSPRSPDDLVPNLHQVDEGNFVPKPLSHVSLEEFSGKCNLFTTVTLSRVIVHGIRECIVFQTLHFYEQCTQISRNNHLHQNTLLMRLLNIPPQPTTDFTLLGAPQEDAFAQFPSTLYPTCKPLCR